MSDRQCAVRQWSPAAGLVTALGIGAVVAAAWCATLWLTDADAPGRLIAGVTAVGLACWAVFGVRARPRLRADPDGLTVRSLVGTRHFPWPLVQEVRVVRYRRLGRDTALLEIDATTAAGDEHLAVLGRFDLGADPQDVADALAATRP